MLMAASLEFRWGVILLFYLEVEGISPRLLHLLGVLRQPPRVDNNNSSHRDRSSLRASRVASLSPERPRDGRGVGRPLQGSLLKEHLKSLVGRAFNSLVVHLVVQDLAVDLASLMVSLATRLLSVLDIRIIHLVRGQLH